MKVIAVKNFKDLKENKKRKKNDVFEVSKERYEEINPIKHGMLVEEISKDALTKLSADEQKKIVQELNGDLKELTNEEKRIAFILEN